MGCPVSENDIALYVEGDLTPARAGEVETHLRACGACFSLTEELRDSQSVLKTIKQDTVSSSALAHVRGQILAEVGTVKVGLGRWVYALAGFAFVCAICIGVAAHLHQRVANGSVPAPIAAIAVSNAPSRVDAPVAALPQAPAISSVETKRPSHKSQTQAFARGDTRSEPAKEVVVQLLTEDPNVVIYWLVDEKNGDSL